MINELNRPCVDWKNAMASNKMTTINEKSMIRH